MFFRLSAQIGPPELLSALTFTGMSHSYDQFIQKIHWLLAAAPERSTGSKFVSCQTEKKHAQTERRSGHRFTHQSPVYCGQEQLWVQQQTGIRLSRTSLQQDRTGGVFMCDWEDPGSLPELRLPRSGRQQAVLGPSSLAGRNHFKCLVGFFVRLFESWLPVCGFAPVSVCRLSLWLSDQRRPQLLRQAACLVSALWLHRTDVCRCVTQCVFLM